MERVATRASSRREADRHRRPTAALTARSGCVTIAQIERPRSERRLDAFDEDQARLRQGFERVAAPQHEIGRPAFCQRPSMVGDARSEEHTSELQSLMRISYAVFCLKKKKHNIHH